MPRYAITEKAGRFVAGTNNTGVGTVLTLTEKQAEHEVRLGALEPLDGPLPEPATERTQAEPDPAPKPVEPKGGQKRGK